MVQILDVLGNFYFSIVFFNFIFSRKCRTIVTWFLTFLLYSSSYFGIIFSSFLFLFIALHSMICIMGITFTSLYTSSDYFSVKLALGYLPIPYIKHTPDYSRQGKYIHEYLDHPVDYSGRII